MCLVVEFKGKTIRICSKKGAKKEADPVDVTNIQELSGMGIPHSDKSKVEAHVETLKGKTQPVVNCASGLHRSVVVAILFLAETTQSTVQEAYDAVKTADEGHIHKMVKASLGTLGHPVSDK